MKRALALFTVLLFGIVGLAQISGSWSGKIQLVQTPSLVSTELILNYPVAGFDIKSISKFNSSGFESQKFGISGPVGPFDVSVTMAFDAAKVAYSYTEVESKISFAGVDITAGVFHGVYNYAVDYFEYAYYPLKWDDLCPQQTIDDTLMLYTFKTAVDPVTLQVRFLDCCEGIEFYDFYLWLEDLSLCCGIAYDFELHFTKEGFDYVLFSIDPLFELCCNISFGVDVKFTVDAKSVTPKFKWGGIEGCVTVYGDVVQTDTSITGWVLYGYKISCELAECYSLEFFHAFDVTKVEEILRNPYIFEGNEFEYVKFTACGPGCCGGNWTLAGTIYFDNGGDLFGISRLTVDASVPVMDALTIGLSFESPNTIYFKWTFTF